ncbi:efflux RND transporter periplasmic adaptor subunit [Cellulophaga baltica]|uniref:efflux RND transporter periplasmic adaptor subunit n=1 Tax=Cellulophaga TaxID=104264 RepID=UPI001C07CF83|nr:MULTISPECIES: HlyD family efflux transporter periplasmic adaptor subunit [Cellulophaga]MBU2995423.1 efflux RND transporter periplasmic adaptor subunit [Cellulophaga baltica]MDO6766817.1 HlyD family efflux transporter periplasmic adaptor subunit [Cellulophaga sp. 1_MG-2023]
MRKIVLSILGIVLIALSIYAAIALVNNKKTNKPKPDKVVKTVFSSKVKNGTVPIVISAHGNVVAKRRVELYAEVQGVFNKGSKLFKTGESYNRGETIIRIDASEYTATVQSAKSNLYNLLTSIMPDLRLDYPEIYDKWQAYLSSFDMNAVTPELPEMTTDKEKYFITGREILTSYYDVKTLEQRLAKYRITAPFKGVLTEALVNEGTLVRTGQKLGEFINTDVYELEVSVPKTYSDLLKIGESVTLINLDKTDEYTGIVTRINGNVDQESQTIKAFIEIKNEGLKEGMYLEAKLNAKKEENAIEVDRGLLSEANQIFVIRDSILDVVDVTPIYFSDKTVILKGVPEGETIVAKPIVGAYAGMLVKKIDVNQENTVD